MKWQGWAALVALFGFVYVQSYVGRVHLWESQVAGCERSKLDRRANAAGWRTAERARRAAGEIGVANRYGRIAAGQEARSRIRCDVVFPKPSPLP